MAVVQEAEYIVRSVHLIASIRKLRGSQRGKLHVVMLSADHRRRRPNARGHHRSVNNELGYVYNTPVDKYGFHCDFCAFTSANVGVDSRGSRSRAGSSEDSG